MSKIHSGPPQEWQTGHFACITELAGGRPNACVEALYALCCTPCALSTAKSRSDETNCLFNFCCFGNCAPLAGMSMIRHHYNLEGSEIGDCFYFCCCPPCAAYRVLAESSRRGSIMRSNERPPYSAPLSRTEQWHAPFFSCDIFSLLYACCLPCCYAHDVRKKFHPNANWCFDVCCVIPDSMYGTVRGMKRIAPACPGMDPHGLCDDLCIAHCCYPCALYRARTELENSAQNVIS